jgi:hypothetical protein
MAATRNETQITWSSASSVTVSSATVVWSDPLLFHVDDWEAEVQVHADNAGTPASGDVCNVFIAYTTGDILGDSGNDYATVEHSEFVTQLDTLATNNPGEDPASRSFPVRTAALGFKVGVHCPLSSGRNIVVRARVVTHRGP